MTILYGQERDLGDEYGWKQVHGDVFRPPSYNMFFSALIGTGYQLTTVVLCVIIFAIFGELYTELVSKKKDFISKFLLKFVLGEAPCCPRLFSCMPLPHQ